MKTKRNFWMGLILIILLMGCSSSSSDGQDASGMTVINVQTTPALAHWLPAVADCANAIQNLGVYAEILPRNELDPNQVDLTLRLGEKLEADPYVSVMGNERLVVVAGADVPVDSLSLENLQAIYSGKWDNWSFLPEAADLSIDDNSPLVTLSYPNNNELEQFFNQIYLSNKSIASNPLRYSTIDRLTTTLEQYPSAIGYALSSQVPSGIKPLEVSDMEADPMLFVLAVTPIEPAGGLRQLLLCLQDAQ
jgi:hypothetical protein